MIHDHTKWGPADQIGAGNLLTVSIGANVRSGPGTNYPVVGTIKAGDTATVVGRNVSSTWFVISFRGGFAGSGIGMRSVDWAILDCSVTAARASP